MFDVGFAEIFLLALIGLLVLGPERLPGVARTLGGFVRKARTSWISLRNTIESEMAEADLSKPIKKTTEELNQIAKNLTETPVIPPEKREGDIAGPGSKSADTTQSDPSQQADSKKSENA